MAMSGVARALRATLPASLALLLLAEISQAKVGEFTAADYLRGCTSTDPSWKPQNQDQQDTAAFCVGYIEAAVEFIVLMDRRTYCLPTGATPQDLLKATVAFMKAHPEQKQYLFASVMMAAVQDHWPCQ
jgi:hypothetical protein